MRKIRKSGIDHFSLQHYENQDSLTDISMNSRKVDFKYKSQYELVANKLIARKWTDCSETLWTQHLLHSSASIFFFSSNSLQNSSLEEEKDNRRQLQNF